MKLNDIEQNILTDTREFAQHNNIQFDNMTESMIINAIREYVRQTVKPILILRFPQMDNESQSKIETSIQHIKDYIKDEYYVLSFWDNKATELNITLLNDDDLISRNQQKLIDNIQIFLNEKT